MGIQACSAGCSSRTSFFPFYSHALVSFSDSSNQDRFLSNSQGITDVLTIEIPAPAVFVDLSQNLLENIPRNSFKNLPFLDHLDLYSNRIEIIEDHSFETLANLTIFHMHNNRLREITSFMFSGLFSLLELSLNNNNIRFIQNGSFSDLMNLARLKLQNNLLRIISLNIFHPIKHPRNLADFNMKNNTLLCNNDMIWMIRAKWLHITHNSETICSGPDEVEGALWSEWSQEFGKNLCHKFRPLSSRTLVGLLVRQTDIHTTAVVTKSKFTPQNLQITSFLQPIINWN